MLCLLLTKEEQRKLTSKIQQYNWKKEYLFLLLWIESIFYTEFVETYHSWHHDNVGSHRSVYDQHFHYAANPQENINGVNNTTIFECSTVIGYGETHYECKYETEDGKKIHYVPITWPPTLQFMCECYSICQKYLWKVMILIETSQYEICDQNSLCVQIFSSRNNCNLCEINAFENCIIIHRKKF